MYKNPYIKIKPLSHSPYTEFFLIRHCHPNYHLKKKLGEYNMPLSELGKKQRGFLTKKLITMKVDQVYVSGLPRAQETASAYIRRTKKKIIIDKRLDEIDWLDWRDLKYFNMSEKTRQKKLKNYLKLDKDLDKMQTEARRALADIFHSYPGKSIAIFSHGNFIRAVLTGILNADVIGFLSLEIFQSSISRFVVDRQGYVKISYINDTSHLPSSFIKDSFINE